MTKPKSYVPQYYRLSAFNMVYTDIHNERIRAHEKHGAKGNSREDAHWENNEWLPILVEEVGEVAHLLTYDTEKTKSQLRQELIQVAAMATAWIVAIDAQAEEDNNPHPGTWEFELENP